MRSLGETIRDRRKVKGFTRSELERETKIRKSFLEALENGNWSALPEFTVVYGFVASISHVLDMDEGLALALLRRDYPRKNEILTPKPDVKNKFIWSPRWSLITATFIIIIMILGYLGYQYKQFVSPPILAVTNPHDTELVTSHSYKVEGKTSPGASIYVNNQPALVDEAGNFQTEIEIAKDMKEITIRATSRSGKVTEMKRKIEVQL